MHVFDVVLILAGACGIVMVLGGVALLWKGVITLGARSKEQAFSIQFRKDFRITTQVPALGIFLIGWCFIVVALYLSPKTREIEVRGVAAGVDEPITVSVGSEWGRLESHGGQVGGKVHAETKYLIVTVSAPGYMPRDTAYSSDGGVIDLGKVSLLRLNATFSESDTVYVAGPGPKTSHTLAEKEGI